MGTTAGLTLKRVKSMRQQQVGSALEGHGKEKSVSLVSYIIEKGWETG